MSPPGNRRERHPVEWASTAPLLFQAKPAITSKPSTSAAVAPWATRSRRPVRFTTEWGLPVASTPVAASKTSLLRFSQSNSRMAASTKPPNCSQRREPATPNCHPAASSTGITATEYIGHLIAAFHKRRRSA